MRDMLHASGHSKFAEQVSVSSSKILWSICQVSGNSQASMMKQLNSDVFLFFLKDMQVGEQMDHIQMIHKLQ